MINFIENVPLAPLTTLKVGGPARFFVRVEDEESVADAFEQADRSGLRVFVLGGGSNILVADRGFDGLVIQIGLKGITVADNSIVTAGAGEDWDRLVEHCVELDLAGFECLSGIPGFVGGTPVQNVGAYGQEVSETVVSVRCYDRSAEKTVELSNSDCGFQYRHSIFNSAKRDRYVVLSVTYRLAKGGEPKIVYKDLQEVFGSSRPTLFQVRDAVLGIRRAKSMVIESTDPNSQSAGSFFKNPIVDQAVYESIVSENGAVPSFPAAPGKAKLPAAWMIERSGFHKGYRRKNAGISSNHALALVNLGGATASEIVSLKEEIQEAVEKKFGILLLPEPVFVGFD